MNEFEEAIKKLDEEREHLLTLWKAGLPINYEGPIPRPKCDCETWGCFGCLDTHQQIRGAQGTYS